MEYIRKFIKTQESIWYVSLYSQKQSFKLCVRTNSLEGELETGIPLHGMRSCGRRAEWKTCVCVLLILLGYSLLTVLY